MNLATISLSFIKSKLSLYGLKEKFIELDGFSLQYYDNEGAKPTLVLLNGFVASTEFQWHKMISSIRKDNRVILVNLISFGLSSSKNSEDCRLNNQINAIEVLFNSLKVKKANIAGISYGGLVAAEFAEKNSAKIARLILINTPTKFLDLDRIEGYLLSEGLTSIK